MSHAIMNMRRIASLVCLSCSLSGCPSAPDLELPQDDLAVPVVDLRPPPRPDMSMMPSPDLRSPGSIEALWARALHERREGSDHAAVAVDKSRNVIVAGTFGGSIDLGGGPLQSLGSRDVFLATYAADGKHLRSRRFGDARGLTRVYDVATDPSGNVIIAGTFAGTTDLGSGPLVSDASSGDAFLAKYAADGTPLWAKRFGGSKDDFFIRLDIASSGEIFVSGVFYGTADFGGGPLISAGDQDIVVAKYTADGAHQWSKRFGGPDGDEAVHELDPAGDLLIGGHFADTIDLGGGPLTAKGQTDGFLARYTQAGAHVWSKALGGTNRDGIRCISVDSGSRIIVAGRFAGTIDLGGGVLTATRGDDSFLAAFTSGGAHVWAKAFDASGPAAVAVDSGDNILLTGSFSDTTDFGGGVLTSAGESDLFVAKFSAAGAHLLSTRYGANGSELVERMVIDASNSAVLAGLFRHTVDFGTGPLISTENGHSLVLKLKP